MNNINKYLPLIIGISVAAVFLYDPYSFVKQAANLLNVILYTTFTFINVVFSHLLSFLFYLYIFVMLLIPQVLVMCVLAYKSKPDDSSFSTYLDGLIKSMETENFIGEKPDEKSLKNKIFNYVQFKTQLLLVKKVVSVKNSYQSDYILCKIVTLYVENKKYNFIGLFNAWFPLP